MANSLNPSGTPGSAYSLSALLEIASRMYGQQAIRTIRKVKRVTALPGAGSYPAPRHAKSSAVSTTKAARDALAAQLRLQLRATCAELDHQRELIAAEALRLRAMDISQSLETTSTPM
jgi:hypothetical protein